MYVYIGWANAMHGLRSLGLFSTSPLTPPSPTWRSLLLSLSPTPSHTPEGEAAFLLAMQQRMHAHGVQDVTAAMEAASWLGLLSPSTPLPSHNALAPIDALCQVLERSLAFKEGEKDMVAMYHSIVGTKR